MQGRNRVESGTSSGSSHYEVIANAFLRFMTEIIKRSGAAESTDGSVVQV